MNGHWDVTETKEFLEGIRTGQEEVRLKDYLVYRPIPKAILVSLRDKPTMHPESYEMQLKWRTKNARKTPTELSCHGGMANRTKHPN
jgi:hypothetical protein